ncbi:sulfotransferase 4A1-like [Mercenaria mercenaria]|uniref:sulfotransferase 4A1-like n=1 Tax=Mercenaria mercenaria TaxID=6596 RepID=UPI00234E5D85|nr:sulfotransferase 4A1-like [Mercenaria mercenaria]XP_053373340.1 sulfotransferase 4A1-like [Mercenaria mercenaria]XP_053373341.1 sulfotransferase 4A1-like [Mercenaria mercenaria]
MAEQKEEATKPRLFLKRKVYKGVTMMENEVEEIEKMETRENDIWVCTFPRSGTTMTQEMVYLIQTLDFDTAKAVQIQERFPIIDVKDDRYPYYKGLKYIEQMKSPRFIKTHLHHFLLPEQLQKGKGRIIYMVRNPKDVVISFYRLMHWGDQLAEDETTFDQFVDTFVNGTGYACPWPRHVLEYWERRDDKNVLFLRYEDVIKDKPAAIRQIADFLGRKLTEEDVQRITEHCKVENMRENPTVNLAYFRDIKSVNDDAEGRFINTGQSGTWQDKLTPEQNEKVDRLIQALDGSGLVF